jgi:hypothetical protein
MKRLISASSVAACLYLGLSVPLLAAEPAGTANPPAPAEKTAAAVQPAVQCLSDLRAFDGQM